jgi:PD-(D/E)XK endonuclease
MNSKAKGEISEGHVIAHLLKRGYSVSMPFGDNQRYDLIWDDGERLWRAQVKTARLRQGCIVFNCTSINGFTGKRTGYEGQIDLFLVYSPDTDKVYRVPVSDAAASSIMLRIEPTRGGPKTTIRWAADYELA